MKINHIRCSGLARPMSCAGSLHFENLPQQEDKSAAEEGTAYGELVERMLTGQEVGTHASNGVPFDGDMHFYAEDTVKEINNSRESEVLCEQRIDWQTRSGIWIKGSYDVSFIREGRLYIDDNKYGWNIVEPEGNWQLLGYAIGEVIRRQTAFSEIVVRIHQPRPHHHEGAIREWRVTYDELLQWKETIELRMMEIADGADDLATGPQCKYCPAAAMCPAFNKAFWRGVDETHRFVQDNMSDEELGFQLDLYDRIKEIFKIRKDSLEQLAVDRVKKGKIIPGWITEQNYGHRAWKSNVDAEFIKMVTGKDVTKVDMLSPAQAEKKGVSKKLVEELSSRPFRGQKLKKGDVSKIADKIFGDPNA